MVAGPARRAFWNLTDQVVSSLTNVALSVLVARSVDSESFGGFAVAFTVFSLALGVSRSICTSPLAIRFASMSSDDGRAPAAAVGSALLMGVATGAACVLGAVWLGVDDVVGQALLALGVVFPALTVQDAYRYVFFARGAPALAALNDAVWGVVQLAAVTGLVLADLSAVGALVLAWGASAGAAAALAVRHARTWPRPRATPGWLREHRDLTGYVFASFGTAHGCHQGAILVIAAVGSLEAVGALRGAYIVLGPAAILIMSASAFAVPEFARRRSTLTARQWTRSALLVSGVVSGLGLCWGVLFLLLPDAVGTALLGPTWSGTSQILLAAVVGQVGTAFAIGPVAMLHAMDRSKVTLRVHVVLGPLTFLGGVAGVAVGGALGAAWGLAAAAWIGVPLFLLQLRREVRRPDPAPGSLRGRHRSRRAGSNA